MASTTELNFEHELEELQEEMNSVSVKIAKEFNDLKSQALNVVDILEKNYNENCSNTNFDDQELVEEQLDILIHEYGKIKASLRYGREVRFYMEKKEQQKSNELRYARNVLAHLGIEPIR